MPSCSQCNSDHMRREIQRNDALVLGHRMSVFVPVVTCEGCGHEVRSQPVVAPAAPGPYADCAQCSAALPPGIVNHSIEPLRGTRRHVATCVQVCGQCGREERSVIMGNTDTRAVQHALAGRDAVVEIACSALLDVARDAREEDDGLTLVRLRNFTTELRRQLK